MHIENISYTIKCDNCNKIMKKKDNIYLFSVGPCGLTDYYRTDEVCHKCAKEYRKEGIPEI